MFHAAEIVSAQCLCDLKSGRVLADAMPVKGDTDKDEAQEGERRDDVDLAMPREGHVEVAFVYSLMLVKGIQERHGRRRRLARIISAEQ